LQKTVSGSMLDKPILTEAARGSFRAPLVAAPAPTMSGPS
jgi:hypothetical protein